MLKFFKKIILPIKAVFSKKLDLTYKVYKLEDRLSRLERTNFALLKQLLQVAETLNLESSSKTKKTKISTNMNIPMPNTDSKKPTYH